MDEMEEYRERIERGSGDRRRKNDRRHRRLERPAPRFFDWGFTIEIVFLVGIAVALFFLN